MLLIQWSLYFKITYGPRNYGLKCKVVLKGRYIYIENTRVVSLICSLKIEGSLKKVLNSRDHCAFYHFVFTILSHWFNYSYPTYIMYYFYIMYWLVSIIDTSICNCRPLYMYFTPKFLRLSASSILNLGTFSPRFAPPLRPDHVWGWAVLDRLEHQEHQQSQQVSCQLSGDCEKSPGFSNGYSYIPFREPTSM